MFAKHLFLEYVCFCRGYLWSEILQLHNIYYIEHGAMNSDDEGPTIYKDSEVVPSSSESGSESRV